LKEGRVIFRYDYILVAAVLLLTSLGMVTLYSASYLFAANQPLRFRDGWAPLFGNFWACVIMVALFPTLALIKLDWLKKGWVIVSVVMVTAALNVLPFLEFFQKTTHRQGVDAMRWIALKHGGRDLVNFQPSELIKVALPLYLAYILDKNKDKLDKFVYGPLPPVLLTALFCILVLFQSNFSEAALIALTSLIICFAAGIRLRWFAVALLLLALVSYGLIIGNPEGRWYQRIANFGMQERDPTDTGYQITLSIEAIKSGGFWGKGIGQGTLKMRMPEVHGDFVFASFAEESGFIGVFLYLLLTAVFAGICYLSAWKSRNRYTQLLAFGLVTPIAVQTLLNIAVVANLIPTTGVPLPFVSSGGSSLLMTLSGAALLVNVTRQQIISEEMGGVYAR